MQCMRSKVQHVIYMCVRPDDIYLLIFLYKEYCMSIVWYVLKSIYILARRTSRKPGPGPGPNPFEPGPDRTHDAAHDYIHLFRRCSSICASDS